MNNSKHYLEGRAFKKSGKYDLAYAAYQKAIQSGDDKGYYGLTLLYEELNNTDVDLEKMYSDCFYAIKDMALEGDYIAASIIGVYYAMGLGNMEKNQEQAHMWFLIGALGGDEVAQFNLAVNYYFGEVVKQNHTTAKMWLESAIDKGYEAALQFYNEIEQEQKQGEENDF